MTDTRDVPPTAEAMERLMGPLELKQLRQHHGWTQARLAREIGVSRGLVARWEQGSLKFRRMAQLAVLAAVAVGTCEMLSAQEER